MNKKIAAKIYNIYKSYQDEKEFKQERKCKLIKLK